MTAGAPGDFEMFWAQSGMNWMKIAPMISPCNEPSPAMTTPTRRKIDSATGNVSGLT